jgi:hypothetical protein
MSKKDFEAIARTMSQVMPENEDSLAYGQWALTCASLALRFSARYPRFDEEKFLAACEQ